MIPNEGTASKTAEDVEVKKSEQTEEEEEEEPKQEETWEFITDQLLLKKDRVSLDGCVYRGEGNANVVLALPSDHKVLRFRKSSPTTEASPDGGRARTTREINFLKYVISGFLGNFVEPPKPIQVTREDMVKVSEAIRPLRPENRRRKEIVEDYATMFADYAFLPGNLTTLLHNRSLQSRATFCVEIKPKQGFRHEHDEQFKKCTYCLTQYYKLKTRAIRSLSSYCPCDLFSGNIERMKKSILGLVKSPQNNLKVFRDGVLVYDFTSEPSNIQTLFAEWFSTGGPRTEEENFENFFKLVSTALLREFPPSSKRNHRTKGKLAFPFSFPDFDPEPRINPEIVSRAKKILYISGDECNFNGNEIPAGSVLGRILQMQQLPYHSADLVYKVYSKHFASLNDEVVYSQMIRTHKGENKAYVTDRKANRDDLRSSKAARNSTDSFKSRSRISDTNGNENKSILYPVASVSSLDLENNNNRRIGNIKGEDKGSMTIQEFEALQNYLLVTTAKDCSILMAFQEIDSKDAENIPVEHVVQTTDKVNFVVNIGVLDLDPKSIHCIEKHRLRDTNVLVSLVNMLEDQLDFRDELPSA